MRTKTALKNIIVSLGSYGFLLVVGLLLRRLLLDNFDVELVAYEGLLSNIFSLLAIADMNVGGLFGYRMFRAFAEQDEARINQLTSMFRMMYRVIGYLMILGCGVIFFLLPVIFAGKVTMWGYFRAMYLIYAVSAVSSYFFGYWGTLLLAGQKDYQAVAIRTTIQFITQVLRVVILWTTKDFLLYLFVSMVSDLLIQLLIAYRAKKVYPNVKIVKVHWDEYRKEGFFTEMRQLLAIKFSTVVMDSTDSMLITFLIDIRSAALYANYCLIGSRILSIFTRLIAPAQATMADLINKESKVDSYKVYRTLDLGCFFLASILFVCFTVVFQPAITVFFGGDLLLPAGFVLAYSIQNYINMKWQAVRQLRGCFGEYRTEKKYSFIGTVINLLVSIFLAKIMGITGIVLGTIIAKLFFWMSDFIIVDRKFFGKALLIRWGREVFFLLLAFAELGVTRLITNRLPYTLWGMLSCGVVGVVVPTAINLLLFFRTEAFRGIWIRILSVLSSFTNRGRGVSE